MTVKEVAELERVSPRMVQRYISEGYKGCKLPAVRVGKSFQVTESDYLAWRVLCGFAQPEPQPQVSQVSSEESSEQGTPQEAGGFHPAYPPWPQPADPNGPITNAPHEHSSNFPHPEACRIYMEEQLRKQQIQIRGYADEN